jgi:hypothetical protein
MDGRAEHVIDGGPAAMVDVVDGPLSSLLPFLGRL